jgi:cytochrome P450
MPLPPGSRGLPLIGETLALLRDPFRFLEDRRRRYGDVFSGNVLGHRTAFLSGLDGAEAFYGEAIVRDHAHPYTIADLFGGTNMEMFDGPRHLALKTITLQAFDERAIDGYLPALRATFDQELARWSARGEVRAAPELQRTSIAAIWGSVMGSVTEEEIAAVTADYATVLRGITSVPVALPVTPYGRARAARDRLLARIGREVVARRRTPTGDGLSTMLGATAPDAEPITDREAALEVHHIVIAGFIVYLLLVEILRRLGTEPDLLARCAEEIDGRVDPSNLTVAALSTMTTCTDVVREAKRIVPIVPLAFGRAARSFTCGGYTIPEGWRVYLALHLHNHDQGIFTEPDRFDPSRFAPDRAEDRAHPLAFIPQGSEPPTGHRCLGLDYSTFMALTFMVVLVSGSTWTLPPQDLALDTGRTPPEPRDGLRVRIVARA